MQSRVQRVGRGAYRLAQLLHVFQRKAVGGGLFLLVAVNGQTEMSMVQLGSLGGIIGRSHIRRAVQEHAHQIPGKSGDLLLIAVESGCGDMAPEQAFNTITGQLHTFTSS